MLSTPLQNFLAKNLTDIDAALDEITEPEPRRAVLSVGCPRCKAGPWSICRTPSGDGRAAHAERRVTARGE